MYDNEFKNSTDPLDSDVLNTLEIQAEEIEDQITDLEELLRIEESKNANSVECVLLRTQIGAFRTVLESQGLRIRFYTPGAYEETT